MAGPYDRLLQTMLLQQQPMQVGENSNVAQALQASRERFHDQMYGPGSLSHGLQESRDSLAGELNAPLGTPSPLYQRFLQLLGGGGQQQGPQGPQRLQQRMTPGGEQFVATGPGRKYIDVNMPRRG